MDTLSEVLSYIRKVPQLYLQEKRATQLEAFILGFLFGKEKTADGLAMEAFREWMHNLPNVEPTAFFANELMQLVGSDEAAFHEFFRRFDDFVRTNPIGIIAPGDLVDKREPNENRKSGPLQQ